MELTESNISCGVYQLCDVGTNPTDSAYNDAMRGCCAAIVVASVPATWRNSIKFLKKKGFKQTHRQITNPNSGNKIVLLAKNVPEKERREYRELCDCGDPSCSAY